MTHRRKMLDIPQKGALAVSKGRCDMQKKWYVASGYGNGREADILLFTADINGRMEIEDTVTQGDCPSFLCVADGKVFVASERSDKAVITSFCVEKEKLIPEKRIEFSGRGLCHLMTGKKLLYAGCYQSGELYVIDHKLKNASCCYSGGIHIHGSVCVGERELLAVDLGRNDILRFDLREGTWQKRLMQVSEANRTIRSDNDLEGQSEQEYAFEELPERIVLRAESGPRQVLYDEKSQKIIVINEKGNSVAFGNRETWHRKLTYRKATQAMCDANYPGGACMDGNGRLFVANRGADTIAVFNIEEDLKFLSEWNCMGHWPRHLYYAEDGLIFAACEKSNELRSFIWKTDRLYPAETVPLVRAACVVGVKNGCTDEEEWGDMDE